MEKKAWLIWQRRESRLEKEGKRKTPEIYIRAGTGWHVTEGRQHALPLKRSKTSEGWMAYWLNPLAVLWLHEAGGQRLQGPTVRDAGDEMTNKGPPCGVPHLSPIADHAAPEVTAHQPSPWLESALISKQMLSYKTRSMTVTSLK